MQDRDKSETSPLRDYAAKLNHFVIGVLAYGGVFIVAMILVGYARFIYERTAPHTGWDNVPLERFALIGDSFGVITAVFTVVAAWVAIWVFRQHQSDMRAARRIMKQQNRINAAQINIERVALQPKFQMECSIMSSTTNLTSQGWLPKKLASKMLELTDKDETKYFQFYLQPSSRDDDMHMADARLFLPPRIDGEKNEAFKVVPNLREVFFAIPVDHVLSERVDMTPVIAYLVYKDVSELRVLRSVFFTSNRGLLGQIVLSMPHFVTLGEDELKLDSYEECQKWQETFGRKEGLTGLDKENS